MIISSRFKASSKKCMCSKRFDFGKHVLLLPDFSDSANWNAVECFTHSRTRFFEYPKCATLSTFIHEEYSVCVRRLPVDTHARFGLGSIFRTKWSISHSKILSQGMQSHQFNQMSPALYISNSTRNNCTATVINRTPLWSPHIWQTIPFEITKNACLHCQKLIGVRNKSDIFSTFKVDIFSVLLTLSVHKHKYLCMKNFKLKTERKTKPNEE